MTTNTNAVNKEIAESGDDNQDKFLSFCLGTEEYGVEILRVREIIGVLDITPLPQTESFVKGVVNLRGKIIPVIELRNKFGMDSIDYNEETCIIVVEVNDSDGGEQFEMGVIVDNVREVKNIGKSQIEPAPKFGCSLSTEYIMGMGKVSEGDIQRVLILLDIDKVMSASAVSDLAQVSKSKNCEEDSQRAAA
ncbi:MAG: purine-binding chemotaxis protein CheW [Phycisphaera sp.]|nr:MAG: purine-binding chemotaxis protein CheW [Phycisphaera sp.]